MANQHEFTLPIADFTEDKEKHGYNVQDNQGSIVSGWNYERPTYYQLANRPMCCFRFNWRRMAERNMYIHKRKLKVTLKQKNFSKYLILHIVCKTTSKCSSLYFTLRSYAASAIMRGGTFVTHPWLYKGSIYCHYRHGTPKMGNWY